MEKIRLLIPAVEQIIEQVEHNFASLSQTALNWKPDSATWSVAECLEHLNRYTIYYIPAIAKRFEKAKPNQEAVVPRSTWLGRMSIQSITPTNTKKQKTMKHLNPTMTGMVTKDIVSLFLKEQRGLLSVLKKSLDYNPNRIKIPIEFFRLLRLNLGDCLQFLVLHEQRHLQQALDINNRRKKARSGGEKEETSPIS